MFLIFLSSHVDRFFFQLLPVLNSPFSSLQLQDNKTFLAMLNHVLSMDGFYFSTTYDLTHTLQRLSNTSPEFQEMSLLERVSCFFRLLNKRDDSFIYKNLHFFLFFFSYSPIPSPGDKLRASCARQVPSHWTILQSCFDFSYS